MTMLIPTSYTFPAMVREYPIPSRIRAHDDEYWLDLHVFS